MLHFGHKNIKNNYKLKNFQSFIMLSLLSYVKLAINKPQKMRKQFIFC